MFHEPLVAILGTVNEAGVFKQIEVRDGVSPCSVELVGDWRGGLRPRFVRAFANPETGTLDVIPAGQPLSWFGKMLTNKFILTSWDSTRFEGRWEKMMLADEEVRKAKAAKRGSDHE